MLTYPFSDPPDPGQLLEVAPGVQWLRMPLPFALDHINLWVLDDASAQQAGAEAGCMLVDCGIDSPETRQHWETIFATGLQQRTVTRILATHFHPDHLGLAHWLCARHHAPLLMTLGEYTMGRLLSGKLPGGDSVSAVEHFRRHGIATPEALEKIAARGDFFARMVPQMPHNYRRLQQGTTLQLAKKTWRVQVGCGHSAEHAALYNAQDNVLISGDMLLPTISTNISVFALEPEANPLPLFMQSLRDFLDFPADMLVLPSHGLPFRGAHARVRQLLAHHEERLERTREWCAQPRHAAEIVPLMFTRVLDLHQTTFALGEALAHLHALWHAGELQRELGADGVYRFVRS